MIGALSKLNVFHEYVKLKMFMMSFEFIEGKVFD
jgi:hypothetical protein